MAASIKSFRIRDTSISSDQRERVKEQSDDKNRKGQAIRPSLSQDSWFRNAYSLGTLMA